MKNGYVTLNIEVTPDGVRVTNGAGEPRMCTGRFRIRFASNDQPELSIHDLDVHGHPVEYTAEGPSGLIASPEQAFKLFREGELFFQESEVFSA